MSRKLILVANISSSAIGNASWTNISHMDGVYSAETASNTVTRLHFAVNHHDVLYARTAIRRKITHATFQYARKVLLAPILQYAAQTAIRHTKPPTQIVPSGLRLEPSTKLHR